MPEFDTFRNFFSLSASAMALASSIYLWITRLKGEKPNLALEQVSPLLAEFVWPRHFPELYQAVAPKEGEGPVRIWADIAIVNNSTMPNAVLQIDASIKLANGKWLPTIVGLREELNLPVNIAPYTSARLALELATKLPYDSSRSSNQDRVDQAVNQLASNREIKVRVRGVNGVAFESVMSQNLLSPNVGTGFFVQAVQNRAA